MVIKITIKSNYYNKWMIIMFMFMMLMIYLFNKKYIFIGKKRIDDDIDVWIKCLQLIKKNFVLNKQTDS